MAKLRRYRGFLLSYCPHTCISPSVTNTTHGWNIGYSLWIYIRILMKVKVESEKVGLKLNIQKTKIMASSSISFSSVAQSCPTLCNPMNCSTPGLPGHHQLLEFMQTHVHRVGDAIQPSHPLSSPSLPAPNPSQHQSLFQWVNSLHEVAKVLEFQL